MDIRKYLIRIHFKGEPKADLDTLKLLHFNHLLNVPFENLDIHLHRKIVLEPEFLFKKIVLSHRGGFCYEMNGLFFLAITNIGFDAKMVSARVYDNTEPGPEFDHMTLIVLINDEEYLADVGFGESFIYPLKLEPGLIQQQSGKFYRIDENGADVFTVKYSEDGKNFNNMYCFSTVSRELEEFAEMCEYHQSSPKSHFKQKRMCTIALNNGRLTLSGLKLIETKNGVRTETPLKNESDFDLKLRELFGISLPQKISIL